MPSMREGEGARAKMLASVVGVHYLGHAAFALRFGGALTAVTDYGAPNAWAEWGWDSRIHDLGRLAPDVMTYSHTHHEDHFDSNRVPRGVRRVLRCGEAGALGGVAISPIGLHEADLGEADSTAYLFTWRGFRVLHLGDCQADIVHIDDDEHRAWIRRVLPERCDVMLLPIESRQRFAAEAVKLLRLLRPVRAVPMHYWSEETLEEFLRCVESANGDLHVERGVGTQLAAPLEETGRGTRVVPLVRAAFAGWRV